MVVANKNRILGRWLLALVLAIGIGGTWTTVAVWMLTVAFNSPSGNYESLTFSPEGEAYIQSYNPRNYQNRSYRKLDGTEVKFEDVSWLSPATAGGERSDRWGMPRVGWNGRIAPINDGGVPATFWYFVHEGDESGMGYFVGYDSVSKRRVGYIDAAGIHENAPEKPFSVPGPRSNYWVTGIASTQNIYTGDNVPEPAYYQQSVGSTFPAWRAYVIDRDRVVEVDLRRRDVAPKELFQHEGMMSLSVHHGFTRANGYALIGAPVRQPVADKAQSQQNDVLVASTRAEIVIYDPAAQEPLVIDRPAETVGKQVSVYRPLTGEVILVHFQPTPDAKLNYTAYRFDSEGKFINQQSVALTSGQPGSATTASLSFAVAAPVPLVAMVTSALLPLGHMEADPSLSYGEAFTRSLAEFWPFPVLTFLISLGLAWLCYRRQKVYADDRIVPWVVLILFAGVPGYVGYLMHRHWPARVRCPSCNELSPRDRESCIDCEAFWPEPERTGAEVFA